MLNFEIDSKSLARFVPRGTELDLWEGRALVSVVGFLFERTRVFGIPIPFHRDFEEVNLRFYVRRRAPEGIRRGVVFVKEIVPKPMIAAVARGFYGERYVAMPMRHRVDLGAGGDPERVGYGFRPHRRWNSLEVTTEQGAAEAQDGSEEQFITEHYWGYAAQRDGSTVEYRVDHSRWRVWRARSAKLDCDVESLYGGEFASALARSPTSAFLADGSVVTVRR